MSKDREPYKMVAHTFHKDCRVGGKQYCSDCGLIALNNDFTAWAIRVGCNHKDHTQYASKRGSFSPLQ